MTSSLLEETRALPLDRLAQRTTIPVADQVLEIGPLSLNQLLALGRLIVSLMARVPSDQLQRILFIGAAIYNSRRGVVAQAPESAAVEPATSPRRRGPERVPAGTKPEPKPAPLRDQNGSAKPPTDLGIDWAPLLLLLDEDVWGQAAAIVTGHDPQWCLNELTLPTIGLVIEAVLDHNDAEVLRRLFTRAAASPPTPLQRYVGPAQLTVLAMIGVTEPVAREHSPAWIEEALETAQHDFNARTAVQIRNVFTGTAAAQHGGALIDP